MMWYWFTYGGRRVWDELGVQIDVHLRLSVDKSQANLCLIPISYGRPPQGIVHITSLYLSYCLLDHTQATLMLYLSSCI